MVGTGRQRPSVSVVIPTHNSTATIERTLASIDAPDIDIEILLVDDASSDLVALRGIASNDPRARLIEKTMRTNAADSRVIGLVAAANDIVFFLDSDDRFLTGYIARRLAMFADSKCSVTFGRFSLDDGDVIRGYAMPGFVQQDMGRYIFVEGGDCRSSTIAVDRSRLGGPTFDRMLVQHQDWAFAIAMQRQGEKIAFDDQVGVIIDCARPARMSGRVRVEASLAFLDRYLPSVQARQGFLLGRLKASAKLGNHAAVRAFQAALVRERPGAKIKVIGLGITVADRVGLTPFLARLIARRKRLGG